MGRTSSPDYDIEISIIALTAQHNNEHSFTLIWQSQGKWTSFFALDPVEYLFSVTHAAIIRYQYRSKVFTQWYAG
jgi:hypothetical protein